MQASVMGDENEIEIKVGNTVYSGELYEMSEDDDEGPEVWQIDGTKIETESIICKGSLEDLARSFLEARGIEVTSITVDSDSFPDDE